MVKNDLSKKLYEYANSMPWLILFGHYLILIIGSLFSINHYVASSFYRGLVIILSLKIIITNYKNIKISFFTLLTISFLVLYSISLVIFRYFDQSKIISDNFYYFLFVTLLPTIFFIGVNDSGNKKIEKLSYKTSLILVPLLVLIFFLFKNNYYLGNDTDGRLSLSYVNPIMLGSFASTITIALVTLSKKKYYLLSLSGILASALIISESGSKGPFIALYLCLILISFYSYSILKSLNYFAILLLTLCLILPNSKIHMRLEEFNKDISSLAQNTVSANNLSSTSTFYRFKIFEEYEKNFSPKFLVFGSARTNNSDYPHNFFVESSVTLAFFGLFASLYMYGYIFRKAFILLGKNNLFIPIITIKTMIEFLFSRSILDSLDLWVLFACLIYLRTNSKK
jgi:hypothetical protein